ncbi:probable G-protein coupled receptor 139 [Microcaecilia unicolor]|uniref:Probable G-protein coupled receptor 139 n=1 Tax=Microcaecilia unicolor TaxID=1415580 RepID=A0A6P7XKY0_9AMPH|nr:probable G-protein coupled receptor 139 [Microcaecilia unicolor]
MEEPWIRTVQRLFYPIMSVFGLPASLITIAVFCKGNLGLSKSIIYYLVALAIANFLLLLVITVFRDIFFFYVDLSTWWPPPSCGISNWIYFTCVYSVTWLTVAFTFDRYVIICGMKLKFRYCTVKTTQQVIVGVYTAAFLIAMPTFWIYVPVPTQVQDLNGTSLEICSIRKDLNEIFILSIYDHFQTTVWIIIPLVLLVLTNSLTVWHIFDTTKLRQGLKKGNTDQNDLETTRRRRSIILLSIITASFLAHWLPKMIIKVVERLTIPPVNRYDFFHPVSIVRMLANMLIVLSSVSNMCMYALGVEKFRQELARGIKASAFTVCKPFIPLSPPSQSQSQNISDLTQ